MASLFLSNSPGAITVKVQPLVLLNICDMYIRRNKDQARVIGTLLGYVADGVVHVQNSYAVPHNENNDQVSLDISHHKTLFELYHKVNSKEHVVGWYATSSGLAGADALIHKLYAGECDRVGINAVYLTVDTGMESGELSIRAYVARKANIGDRTLAMKFQEVEVEVQTAEMESVGADLMKKEVSEKLPADLDGLQTTLKRLEHALERAHAYVDDVVEGRRPADINMGRFLADSITGIPKFSADEFDNMLADSAQDSLLVMYLANLVRAHIALADRLGTASLPLLF